MERPAPYALAFALAASAAALGCATAPEVYRYENLGITIVKADPVMVNDVCSERIELNDQGKPITRRIRCCYLNEPDRSIWMAWGEDDCLLHELCHADGKSPAACHEVQ